MKTLRTINGKMLARNDNIRQTCRVMNVVQCIRKYRDQIKRMNQTRIARHASEGQPIGRRPTGRSHKRWRDSWDRKRFAMRASLH